MSSRGVWNIGLSLAQVQKFRRRQPFGHQLVTPLPRSLLCVLGRKRYSTSSYTIPVTSWIFTSSVWHFWVHSNPSDPSMVRLNAVWGGSIRHLYDWVLYTIARYPISSDRVIGCVFREVVATDLALNWPWPVPFPLEFIALRQNNSFSHGVSNDWKNLGIWSTCSTLFKPYLRWSCQISLRRACRLVSVSKSLQATV